MLTCCAGCFGWNGFLVGPIEFTADAIWAFTLLCFCEFILDLRD
jgi:hypothetical protein